MRRYRLFALAAAASLAADQLTKIWARGALPLDGRGRGVRVPVIDGFFDWVLQFNTGSAFSLFDSGGLGSRVFLSLVALIALGAILWMLRRATAGSRGLPVALGLMAGGALGNLIDRVAFGQVTDFVLWYYDDFFWPVFNVADACLVVSIPLFLVFGYRGEKPAAKPAAEAGGAPAPS